MSIVKLYVCTDCQSPGIRDVNCRCVWDNKYPTMELEFELCDCCNHMSDTPADTEFNRIQFGETEDEEP